MFPPVTMPRAIIKTLSFSRSSRIAGVFCTHSLVLPCDLAHSFTSQIRRV